MGVGGFGQGSFEAFSDGVIAIITIKVLELKVLHEAAFAALAPLWPVLISYDLSFVYLSIYWNSHYHMLAASRTCPAERCGRPAPAVLG